MIKVPTDATPPSLDGLSVCLYSDGEGLGDGIIKLHFLYALREALPSAHITWLISVSSIYFTHLSELANPVIDEIVVHPPGKIRWKNLLDARPLHNRRMDVVADTQMSFRRNLWVWRIRHGRSVFLWPWQRQGSLLDRLINLGQRVAKRPLQFKPLPISNVWTQKAKERLPQEGGYLGLVPGAGFDYKRWPLECFVRLARQVVQEGLTPVIFLGPSEARTEMGAELRKAVPEAVFPLQEGDSPLLTIALAQRLTAAVANDSGGGHLIAAAGIPMVSLIRSNSVRRKFMPATSRVIALTPEDFGGSAMGDIPFEPVEAALKQLLCPSCAESGHKDGPI